MSIRVTTPPNYDANKPIAASLLKSHVSIDSAETDYDAILNLYLLAAVEVFETTTKRAILTQTVKQTFDRFPNESFFLLERAPYIGNVSIQYFSDDDEWVTLSDSVYRVSADSEVPIVQLNTNQTWPTDIHPSALEAVAVSYQCGYGASDTSVPKGIQHILASIVGDMYLNREETVIMPGAAAVELSHASKTAMKRYMLNYYELKSQRRR